MNDLSMFNVLVRRLEECAAFNTEIAGLGSEYARGKSVAFGFAAKWLREEIDFYEKESR